MSEGAHPVIRRLTPGDAEAFRAVRLEGLERQPEAFSASLDNESAKSLMDWRTRLEMTSVFGAFVDNHLMGVAGFYRCTGVKLHHKGVLWGVYVRDEVRGQGVGRALVEAVVGTARGEVDQLLTTVNAANERAKRLYESVGFLVWGIQPRSMKLGSRFVDEAELVLHFT